MTTANLTETSTALMPTSGQDALPSLPAPGRDFEAYLRTLSRVPLLSKKEEADLIWRVRHDRDVQAAHTLTLSNLRFVVHIARKYQGYGLALEELVQEGTVGLIKSIQRFDPAQDIRLISFAVYWIREEIHEYLLRSFRLMKVATTKAQRKLFFNLRKMKKSTYIGEQEAFSIAQDLGVSVDEVYEVEKRMNTPVLSLDAPIGEEGQTLGETVNTSSDQSEVSFESDEINRQAQNQLTQALTSLDTRSQAIIQARFLNEDKATLQTLANELEISVERVRQLETKALSKLKLQLEALPVLS